jgi:glycosyltransferase involved in cell wall biosynthesis
MIVRHLGVDPERVTVTYEASGLSAGSAAHPSAENVRPYFFYVGNAFPYKNLERLIEAFALFRRDSAEPYDLVLAGRHNGFEQHLEAVSARFGVAEAVRLTGPVSDEELSTLYRGACALVFVSLSEGFGLPGLEAMSQATPVIAANSTSLPEIYGDAALYVDALDPRDIARAMTRVATDASLAKRLASDGLTRASEFSWRRTASETLSVYRAVLDDRMGTKVVAIDPSADLTHLPLTQRGRR